MNAIGSSASVGVGKLLGIEILVVILQKLCNSIKIASGVVEKVLILLKQHQVYISIVFIRIFS